MIIDFGRETPIVTAGRKGHNLARMWQAGLPVPAGFCIPCDFVDDVDPAELDCALAKLAARTFAVRSSAICEDAVDMSFAGIFASRLHISAPQVLPAIEEVRNSVSASATAEYSQRLRMSSSPSMAVIVQAFVPAEASGVLFMRDPQSGEEHVVVEAAWGLGPAVVEGIVRPDRWILSNGEIISEHIGDKDVAVVPDDAEGTIQKAVDFACRRRPSLDRNTLNELARIAVECERLFGAPQDVEWACCAGQVWLLQSRPITWPRRQRRSN
jgi:pyruvate,water dikinase